MLTEYGDIMEMLYLNKILNYFDNIGNRIIFRINNSYIILLYTLFYHLLVLIPIIMITYLLFFF